MNRNEEEPITKSKLKQMSLILFQKNKRTTLKGKEKGEGERKN